MAFGVGVAAEQPEEMRAERAPCRPRLLARQPPAAVRVVARRLRLDAGEVAARVRLRPALAPRLLARRHRGQDAVLLFVGAELEDRRREQEDAVLGDPLRRAGAVVLLFEDEPLPQARVAPAVRRGPRHHGVARVEQRAFPFEVRGEARRACRPTGGGHAAHSLRATPGCRAEGLFGGAEREVHEGADASGVAAWSHDLGARR